MTHRVMETEMFLLVAPNDVGLSKVPLTACGLHRTLRTKSAPKWVQSCSLYTETGVSDVK